MEAVAKAATARSIRRRIEETSRCGGRAERAQ
jgi:hypothetical protein